MTTDVEEILSQALSSTPLARVAIRALAARGLAIVPRAATPQILANGWAAINKGRKLRVDMAPGPALTEAWPEMVEAGDLIRQDDVT